MIKFECLGCGGVIRSTTELPRWLWCSRCGNFARAITGWHALFFDIEFLIRSTEHILTQLPRMALRLEGNIGEGGVA